MFGVTSFVCFVFTGRKGRPAAQSQRGITGHVTAVAQPNPTDWVDFLGRFPLPPDEVPNTFTVVLLAAADTEDRVRALLSRAPCLKVRDWSLFRMCVFHPEHGSVVLLYLLPCLNAHCSITQVNETTIRRWCAFLTSEYVPRVPGVSFDDTALAAYDGINDVLPSVVQSALAPTTDEEAGELTRVSVVLCFDVGAEARGMLFEL